LKRREGGRNRGLVTLDSKDCALAPCGLARTSLASRSLARWLRALGGTLWLSSHGATAAGFEPSHPLGWARSSG